MTSTINADKIMNGSGDQDSGLDLLVNDQVKIKTAVNCLCSQISLCF